MSRKSLFIVLFACAAVFLAALAWRPAPEPARDARPSPRAAATPDAPVAATALPNAAAPAVTAATNGRGRKLSKDDPEFKAMVAALGAPLPPDDSAVLDIYEPLLARAGRGDARASCRLALELQRCGRAHVANKAIAHIEGDLARAEQTPESAINYLARVQTGVQHESRGCAGLSDSHFAHAFDLQLQTALREPDARLWLALNPALDEFNFVNELERWTLYRQHAMPWLEQAAADGDPAALIALSRVHGDLRRTGSPHPRFRIADDERFLVYAELMARQGITFSAMTRDLQQARARLDAAALARVAQRVDALHRPDRPQLSETEVKAALDASLRRTPKATDCARLRESA